MGTFTCPKQLRLRGLAIKIESAKPLLRLAISSQEATQLEARRRLQNISGNQFARHFPANHRLVVKRAINVQDDRSDAIHFPRPADTHWVSAEFFFHAVLLPLRKPRESAEGC